MTKTETQEERETTPVQTKPEQQRQSGYRFLLHKRMTEREGNDAFWDLFSDVAIAGFRLIQWCITIGAIAALNHVAPSPWLVAVQGGLWLLLVGYLIGTFSRVEIDLFREVNTWLKWSVNLVVTLAVSLTLLWLTYWTVSAVIDALAAASKLSGP